MTPISLELRRPDVPSLVLVAPPKTGTTSLMDALSRYPDVVQLGVERHYWNARCLETQNASLIWARFLARYANNSSSLSLALRHLTLWNRSELCCNDDYRAEWHRAYHDPLSSARPCLQHKACAYPSNSNSSLSSRRFCYLIEKAPYYARHPLLIAVLFANAFPRVKLLNVVRAPSQHIKSAVFAFDELRNRRNVSAVMRSVLRRLQSLRLLANVSAGCDAINAQWHALSSQGARQRYGAMKHAVYRPFLVGFLWAKHVELQLNHSADFFCVVGLCVSGGAQRAVRLR